MNANEALKVFSMSSVPTPDDLKKLYRRLCAKYHPDRNPNGQERMKDVNVAYSILKKEKVGILPRHNFDIDLAAMMRKYEETCQAKIRLVYAKAKKIPGIILEVSKYEIVARGKTFDAKEDLKKLKFRWDKDRKVWYFRV
jgi:hypothetical protein